MHVERERFVSRETIARHCFQTQKVCDIIDATHRTAGVIFIHAAAHFHDARNTIRQGLPAAESGKSKNARVPFRIEQRMINRGSPGRSDPFNPFHWSPFISSFKSALNRQCAIDFNFHYSRKALFPKRIIKQLSRVKLAGSNDNVKIKKEACF